MGNIQGPIALHATALISNQIALNEEIKNKVDGIFSNVGKAFWVNNESHIDIATAVSGSGPAYFYLFCENNYGLYDKTSM